MMSLDQIIAANNPIEADIISCCSHIERELTRLTHYVESSDIAKTCLADIGALKERTLDAILPERHRNGRKN